MIGRRPIFFALIAAVSLTAGCGTRRFTDTPRTASEQLLVSASVDQAVSQLDFYPVEDRKVYIDDRLVERVDKTYVTATVRALAWRNGCIVVDNAEEADYVAELRCGSVGLDKNEYILGIPAASLPSQIGTVPVPEAAVFKSTNQSGATRISMTVYRRDDRRFLYASGPFYGFSDQTSWWLLGAGPNVSDNVKPRPTDKTRATVPTPTRTIPAPPNDDSE